jgi:dihydrofolate reductase
MNKPKISIISCVAKNRVIGKDNKLLFNLPEDLKHFKKITMGHPIIMGLNTFKSIGRPLPGRLNVILSPDSINIEGCTVVNSIEDAIQVASKEDGIEIFFIGGGMVYKSAIELADRLYLTVVDAEPEADTFFPDYSDFNKIISEEMLETDKYKIKYVTLEK